MPRTARVHSQTGIYHVMLRAINRQQIFFDEEDYSSFISILRHYKKKCGFTLYAYCLMGNHVHLLIGVDKVPLETVMRLVGGTFAYWYNGKYERVGHLFQDRYKSEPVNDARYFLTVLRYILQNPVAAGLCNSPAQYLYSSARQYLLAEPGITDVEYANQLMGEELPHFLRLLSDDCCMDLDVTVKKRFTDERAKELIIREFGTYFPKAPKKAERKELNESICRLIHKGISIRQLSRLTGLTKKVIETGLKEEETGDGSLSPEHSS